MAKNSIDFYVIPKEESHMKKMVRMLVRDYETDDYFLVRKEKYEEFYRLTEAYYKKSGWRHFFRTVAPKWAEYVGSLSNLEILVYSVKE